MTHENNSCDRGNFLAIELPTVAVVVKLILLTKPLVMYRPVELGLIARTTALAYNAYWVGNGSCWYFCWYLAIAN